MNEDAILKGLGKGLALALIALFVWAILRALGRKADRTMAP